MDYILVRILIVAAMLGSSAYFDLKTRRISDRVWIVFGLLACIIYIFDPPAEEQLPLIAISIVFTSSLSVIAYKVGLFGGADVFALILISVLVPSNVNYFHIPEVGAVSQFPIASLTILLNGLLLSMSQSVINLVHNLHYWQRSSKNLFEGFEHETSFHKVVAVIIGQKKYPGAEKYGFSIEKSISNTKYFDFSIKDAEHHEFASKDESIWVSSAIPFLIYIFAGFVLTASGVDPFSIIWNGFISGWH